MPGAIRRRIRPIFNYLGHIFEARGYRLGKDYSAFTLEFVERMLAAIKEITGFTSRASTQLSAK